MTVQKRVLLLVLAVSLVAKAADFWAKKSYQNWSAEETRRILEESPWATTLTLSGIQNNAFSNDTPSNPGYRGEMEANPSISYNIQFRSALPIREAEVRSSQLNSHYDKLTAEQKAVFDANSAKFLAVSFPDRVIVSVTFRTNVANDESLLRNYWATQNVAKLSQTVYLNTATEKLNLMAYGFKDNTFQFTFKRPKELHSDDKVGVEFVHPRIDQVMQQRVLQEFSVKKMLVDGKPAL